MQTKGKDKSKQTFNEAEITDDLIVKVIAIKMLTVVKIIMHEQNKNFNKE